MKRQDVPFRESFRAFSRASFQVPSRASSRAPSRASFGRFFCALFCAVLLCAVLTACAQSDGAASAAPTGPEPPSGTENNSAAPGALPFPVGTLRTVSWASNEGGFYGCSSGTAYYGFVQANVSEDASGNRWEDWLIMRTDFETRVQTPLCSVPGCTHKDDSCPAFLRSRSSMEEFLVGIVNGRLYVLHNYWWELIGRSNADTGKPIVWLEEAALDGSGRTRLMELPPEWHLSDEFSLTDGTALYGQYLDWSDSSRHGIRVELGSGEYTTFSFGLDDDEELIGALDNQFILSRSNEMFPTLAYPDVIASQERYNIPNYFSYVRLTREMVLLDPATGTRRELTESLMPSIDDFTMYASLFTAFFQQQKYYSITGDAVSQPQIVLQSDPATGESRLLAQNEHHQDQGFWSIQGLQLFPSDSDAEEPYIYGSYWEDGNNQGFLLDVHDGAMLPIALRYQNAYSGTSPVIPLAQTDDGLWLVQTEEVPTAWGRYRFFYALAAPETVISGEGEVYPIGMWVSETPLG